MFYISTRSKKKALAKQYTHKIIPNKRSKPWAEPAKTQSNFGPYHLLPRLSKPWTKPVKTQSNFCSLPLTTSFIEALN
jgi:hypothetical protein